MWRSVGSKVADENLLDHVIAVNERHLKRLLSEYVRYYHEDRTHLGLGKGTPNCQNSIQNLRSRPVSGATRRVASSLRSGCLSPTV